MTSQHILALAERKRVADTNRVLSRRRQRCRGVQRYLVRKVNVDAAVRRLQADIQPDFPIRLGIRLRAKGPEKIMANAPSRPRSAPRRANELRRTQRRRAAASPHVNAA